MKNRTTKPERVHLHAYERLVLICAEIQKGNCPTKLKLAEIVERTPRTIQRDLEALRNRFDAPLIFDKKRNGFRFTDSQWKMPPIQLTEGELISFFAAERMLRRLGGTTETNLARTAIAKLATLLPENVVVDIGALQATINFASEPVLDAAPDILRKLVQAANQRQTLTIEYYSQHRAAQTIRDIDVLMLHNNAGEWYAIAYDHLSTEIRDFHAGRIQSITNTRRTFQIPDNWQPNEYLHGGFGMFRGGEKIEIEVEFDEFQARYARERTFHPTEHRQKLSDGRLRISFEATEAALEQVARWLMQYGEHAQAIKPHKLREIMRERLQRTIKHYLEEDEGNNE